MQCVEHSSVPKAKISSITHVQLLQWLHGKQQQQSDVRPSLHTASPLLGSVSSHAPSSTELVRLVIHSFIHSLTTSSIHSFQSSHLFIYIYWFMQSFIHWYIHSSSSHSSIDSYCCCFRGTDLSLVWYVHRDFFLLYQILIWPNISGKSACRIPDIRYKSKYIFFF